MDVIPGKMGAYSQNTNDWYDSHFGWTCPFRGAAWCTDTDAAGSSPPSPAPASPAPEREAEGSLNLDRIGAGRTPPSAPGFLPGWWSRSPRTIWTESGCRGRRSASARLLSQERTKQKLLFWKGNFLSPNQSLNQRKSLCFCTKHL